MHRTKISLFIIAFILVTGCARSPQTINTDNLYELEGLNSASSYGTSEKDIGNLREEAIKETALTLGAQSGLAYRAKQINQTLLKQAAHLTNVFNFGPLMLEHSVLPPVLLQANNILSISEPDSVRISDQTYRIVQQASFVSAPPTWRTYVWMMFSAPELPNKTLLPKSPQEEKIWKKYIALGWQTGIKQADRIFKVNLARLQRDYQGMLLYRNLLAKHMISEPFVAKTNLGVTGDGNSININDQVLRITATPQLQTDSKTWKAVLVK